MANVGHTIYYDTPCENSSFTYSKDTDTNGAWSLYPITEERIVAGRYAPVEYVWSKVEEVKEMRGLFAVYVVDPEEGEVVYQGVVVAKDAKSAEFKVLSAAMKVTEDAHEVDDLDIISVRLGNVRAKQEIATVRVVE